MAHQDQSIRRDIFYIRWIVGLLLLLLLPSTTHCFSFDTFFTNSGGKASSLPSQRVALDPTFERPDVDTIQEDVLCIDTAKRMERVLVPVPSSIHPSGKVGISYVNWPAESETGIPNPFQKTKNPVIVLLHGFDSSALEFRRLGTRLAGSGWDTTAVDLLGWGYTQTDGVLDFSAEAKITAVSSFVDTVIDGPFVIAGASLGGAAALATAVQHPQCQGLILLDAQGFVDGIDPAAAALPQPLMRFGVGILQSWPLRSAANQMSYFDKKQYATDEAVVIGRLHCVREGWNEAMVNFMQSGGFKPVELVPQVKVPTLVVWGRQDGILDGEEFANKFVETIPEARLEWVEECGHVPHLEQPE